MARRRSPGEGSIYQGNDGRWYASVEVGGRGKRKRRRFIGKTREKVRQQLLKAQRDGTKGKGDRKALLAAINAWIDDRERVGKRPKTIGDYRSWARLLVEPFPLARMRVSEIEPDDLDEFDRGMIAAGHSPDARKRARLIIGAAYRFLEKRREVFYNPVLATEPPRIPTRRMEVWNERFGSIFLRAARERGDWYESYYVVALATGMSPSELFGLRWTDVNLDSNVLSILESATEFQGKVHVDDVKREGRRRRLELPAVARQALIEQGARLRAAGVASRYVFPNHAGGPTRINALRARSFKRCVDRAVEIHVRERHDLNEQFPRIRLYDLRHTFATIHLLRGTPVKVVSEMLGHASTKITSDTYQHVLPTMQTAAAATTDAEIGSWLRASTAKNGPAVGPPAAAAG